MKRIPAYGPRDAGILKRLVPRPLYAVASFSMPVASFLARPLGLGPEASFLLGILAQVIVAWTAGFVHRDVASCWLLACFALVGEAGPSQVLTFPLSGNFILIASAFLLSVAISKSGLADRMVRRAFSRFARSPRGLVRFSFVAGAALALFIPQPFPRVIVLSSLYAGFMADKAVPDRERRAVLLSVFVASTGTSMLLRGGDVVLNNAALSLAGASLSYGRWAVLMLAPSLLVTALSYAAIVALFKVSSASFPVPSGDGRADEAARGARRPRLPPSEARVAAVTAALVVAWMSEGLHGVPAAVSAAAAVAILFLTRSIGLRDLKAVNPSLMLFLTAAFSIGKVLAANGIAERLDGLLLRALPPSSSPSYFLAMAVLVMALHFVLGSSLTTMSVAIPSLVAATAGAVPSELVGLFAYSVITMQYFLPIHHVTVMIGAGEGYFEQKDIAALGAVMAVVVPLYAAYALAPWWRLVGAM
ncbi:MAG: anion permease [Spirochaetes bacterium]|nr:anion permease [Spirochaetota bacterium]